MQYSDRLIIYGLCAYFSVVLLAAALYIPKLKQIFGFNKKAERGKADGLRRIALVIPARGESKTIGALFSSIGRQTYDKAHFSVNVIVKDFSDPTVRMAREAGYNVYTVPEQDCKGEALDGYFRLLGEEALFDFDAYVIVDADAVLSDNYVEELNRALSYDKQIFVTRKRVKNYLAGRRARSLWCNLSAMTYPMLDDMANVYRTTKGAPLQLCGQGLMVRTEVISELGGWPYRSLTEDYELKMDGYLRGFTSMYYPHAVLYTEEAVTKSEVYKRRLRWLTGFAQCEKKYAKAVRTKARKEKSADIRYDFLYFAISPFLYLAATAVCIVYGIILAVMAKGLWYLPVLTLCLIPALLTYVLLFTFTLIAMHCYRDAFCRITRGEKVLMALCGPSYWMEYVPIFIKSRFLASKPRGWEQVERVDCGGEIYEEEAESVCHG